jgi:CARDB protein
VKRALAVGLALVLATAPAALAASTGSVRGAVRIVPITVGLVLDPSTAVVGASIKAKATVTNAAAASSATFRLELRLDSAGVVIKSGGNHGLITLKPGRSTTVTWNLCGRTAGTYVVLARAEIDGTFVDSPARLLTIRPGSKQCR